MFDWSPDSATPTVDAFLWIRWIASVVLVWWLPGWILLRGRLHDWPVILVTYARLATGFVWVVVLGLMIRWSGRGLDPLILAVVSSLVALLVSHLASRSFPRPVPSAGADRGPAGWWWVALSGVGLFVAVVYGFRDFSTPPEVHDFSNHAFLIARASAVGSLDPALIFSTVHPPSVYFAGWHLVAAITASVAGISAHVAAWFTSITAIAFVPLGLATLWWRWGAGVASTVAAALWLMTNAELPAGNPYSWGGAGVLVGFFFVPLGALVLAEAARTGNRVLALASGAVLAAAVHIHFSELVVIVPLALLTILMRRRGQEPDAPGERRWWPAAGLFVVGLVLAYDPSMLEGAGDYAGKVDHLRDQVELVGFARALRSFPEGIGPPDLRFPWAIGGTIFLLFARRWRPVAIASLALGALVFALKFWNDPVSSHLATPFYGQAPRVAYQQIYLMPLAAGLATVALVRFVSRRGRVWGVVAAAVAVVALVSGYMKHDRELSTLDARVAFDRAEYFFAKEIADLVDEDEVVANYRDDGSTWAWHVSRRQFLAPMSWPCIASDGTLLMPLARGLRDDPWTVGTRSLEERGVHWLYVSSNRLEVDDVLKPEDFEGDPRFSVALEREGNRLLRINWDLQDE